MSMQEVRSRRSLTVAQSKRLVKDRLPRIVDDLNGLTQASRAKVKVDRVWLFRPNTIPAVVQQIAFAKNLRPLVRASPRRNNGLTRQQRGEWFGPTG